jgi:CDP-diacylglycerol---glycerol-3-phosphate 3-phosphatidyltransferase
MCHPERVNRMFVAFRDFSSASKLKRIFFNPNNLTLVRVAAIPIIVVLLIFPSRLSTFIAALLFSAAAITDFFDGFLARQQGTVSSFGKIMDPVADKLLVSSAFIMLASHGWVPAWIVCIIIGRELAINGLRNVAVQKGEDVSASNLGKYKTGFQIAAIIPLIFHYPYFGLDLHAIGTFFLWGALILTVWSGADYWFRFTRFFRG